MSTTASSESPKPKYRMHWHVLFTHFPLALFAVTFGFQVLHLFWSSANFELAANITLIAGAFIMIPTTLSGWLTWKSHYKGAKVPLFKKKISIALAMLVFSVALVLWRVLAYNFTNDIPVGPAHWFYFAGSLLLIFGAAAEGYYGGKLNHR